MIDNFLVDANMTPGPTLKSMASMANNDVFSHFNMLQY